MRSATLGWICGLLVLTASCDKEDESSKRAEEIAAAYCDWVFSCDCEVFEYHDGDECLTVERNYFSAAFEAGEYDGRTLDEECYADLLEKVGGTSCDPEEAFEDDSECSICKLYYGPLEEGDDCDQSWVWDECGKGLACIEGECTDPCPELGEGESCVTEGGLVLGCESGLECDYNTETCTKPAGIGDSCEKVSCGEGLCDYDTFTCTAGAGEGESCGAGCAEGLWCDYGADGTGPMICRAAAEPGDSCANGEVCSTWCDGEVCVDPPEASCYE